jgi:non-homologous end joining protein Ku
VAQSEVTAASQPSAAAAPVVDILEALKKSLAMARKPAASETQPARKTPARVTDIKSKRQSRKAH